MRFLVMILVLVGSASSADVHALNDDGEAAAASAAVIATGKYTMAPLTTTREELGESASGTWSNVALPVQLRWGKDNECLHFRSKAKVDAFFCGDDPAGEAAWTLVDGKLRAWGDETQCLHTDDSDEPKLKACSSVPADDGWSAPALAGGYGDVKSKKTNKCLGPNQGTGARDVKLVPCGNDSRNWKQDVLPTAKAGSCAVRWKKNAAGVTVYSGVPAHRSCFKSTGTSLGTWKDELVLETDMATGFKKTDGRLINNAMGNAPGCKAFNYEGTIHSCEPVTRHKSAAAPMDMDQSGTNKGWAYYEPKVSTVGTKCSASCLPTNVIRLEYPKGGGKFGDTAGVLPDVVVGHFDKVVFPGNAATKAECHANVDAITIEVQASCQAAKTSVCAPDKTDASKEVCTVNKEAVCRRMTVMPTTFFSNEKTSYRTKCGHGAQEDGKVWHAARIAVDTCGPVNGFTNFCGSVEGIH